MIEPIYRNIYVKANISGEFTIVNAHLVRDLKALGLWSADMLDHLKYHDGNLRMIAGVPDRLKENYQGEFEVDPSRRCRRPPCAASGSIRARRTRCS